MPDYAASHIMRQKFLMGLICRTLIITIAGTKKSKFERRETSKLKTHFRSKKEKALRECRKLQDEETDSLRTSRNVMRSTKLKD